MASPKSSILDAAAAVFARNPGASIADVADAAGVGRATLYRHFESRDGLVRALALEALAQTARAVAPVVEAADRGGARLEALVEALVPVGARFHFLMNEAAVYADPEVSEAYDRHLAALRSVVDGARADGALAPDVPTAWGVAAIDALVWAAWSTVEGGYVAPHDAAPLVVRTLLHGLTPSDP